MQPGNPDEGLEGFAQPHVIGQDAAEMVRGQVSQEMEPLRLVGPQRGADSRWQLRCDPRANLRGAPLEPAVGVEPELPPALCQASPLAGVEPMHAPHAGVLVFHCQPGEDIQQGQAVCDVLDAASGQRSTLCAGVAGKLYAHTSLRYAYRGMEVCRIAGLQAFRSGKLLSL